MIRMKRVQPGERIPIRLTDHERKLILDHTFIGGDLERRIRVVAADGPAVVIALDLDDLEELLGHVAAEANHSKDPSVAKHLSRVHERLSRIVETHADADEPLAAAAAEGPSPPRYTSKQGQYLSVHLLLHQDPSRSSGRIRPAALLQRVGTGRTPDDLDPRSPRFSRTRLRRIAVDPLALVSR